MGCSAQLRCCDLTTDGRPSRSARLSHGPPQTERPDEHGWEYLLAPPAKARANQSGHRKLTRVRASCTPARILAGRNVRCSLIEPPGLHNRHKTARPSPIPYPPTPTEYAQRQRAAPTV